MSRMEFMLHDRNGIHAAAFNYDRLFAVGYAGRRVAETMAHIGELEKELGVPAPKRIPTIFQCGNYTLTQERDLHFVGEKTCGEAEYVILMDGGKIYIGIGSDHTDRELERASIPKSKQVCAKPIGRFIWDYEEIRDHWDHIRLTSWQVVDGKRVPYQRGTLEELWLPEKLLEELRARVGKLDHAVIYSGTVPLLNGFQFGTEFICELEDEEEGRKLTLDYRVLAVSEEER